jgi:predicted dehydrogenase
VKRTVEGAARTVAIRRTRSGRVRVGVIGAGVFGGYHAQKFATSAHSTFVGAFDLSIDAARAVCAKAGQGEAFSSLEDLFAACDAVVIATPAATHAHLARRSLEAGKHTLVEKPLALTGGEARSLARLALDRDLVLQVGHQERLVFEAMGLFATGERPLRIEAVRMNQRSPDARCEDVSVVFDLMIHDLDLAAELMGGDVAAVAGDGMRAHTRYLDHASADLEFASGSAKLTASRCAAERERRMRIEYSCGTVEIDFLTRKVRNTTPFEIRADVSAILPDPLRAADEAFLAAIQGRGASRITGGVGARAAAMAETVETGAMDTVSAAAAA